MATTTIEDGYMYVTTGTVSTNTITHNYVRDCVPIAISGKIKYGGKKNIGGTAIPVSRNSGTAKAPRRFMIDLKRIDQTVTVTGKLWGGLNSIGRHADEGGGTTTQTTHQLLDNLLYIFGASSTYLRSGAFTIVWGIGNNRKQYTVNTTNWDIEEDSKTEDSGSNRRFMEGTIQFLIGEDR